VSGTFLKLVNYGNFKTNYYPHNDCFPFILDLGFVKAVGIGRMIRRSHYCRHFSDHEFGCGMGPFIEHGVYESFNSWVSAGICTKWHFSALCHFRGSPALVAFETHSQGI
jgi:hypothetical protein